MKKLLLLFCISVCITGVSLAQTPVNKSVKNTPKSGYQSASLQLQVKEKSKEQLQIEKEINSLKKEKTTIKKELNKKELVDYKQPKTIKTNTNIARTPTNISVANATLVDQSLFFDNNINISEAPNSNGGFNGCNISGFNIIYYKFTAESDNDAYAFIYDYDGLNIAANTSLAIFYTANDLNATSESDLTVFSNCAYGSYTPVTLTKDTTYYIAIHRSGNFNSNIQIKIPLDVSAAEKTALTELYNSTNGDNWNNNANWNSTLPVSEWNRVTVKDGHVNKINLYNNNATGTLPTSLDSFTELTELDLATNAITGNLPANLANLTKLETLYLTNNEFSGVIPDLTGLNLSTFWFDNNLFEFGDFENEYVNYTTNINSFKNSPQKTKPNLQLDGSEVVAIGDNRTLTVVVSGAENTYYWYKGNTYLGESTNGTWTITNIQTEDFGEYYVYIESNIVTNLGITSEKKFIGDNTDPTTTPDYNTLVDFYNSMNGANWTDNSNWLSTEPIYKWKGLKIGENNKVIEIDLSGNNLSGTIPSYIQNFDALKKLNLSGNEITGSIPTTIGNLTNLEYLSFSNNKITGSIPATIGNLTLLEELSLSNSDISGSIPSQIGNLTNLKELFLGRTQVSGSIPKELGNLTNLTWLHLWGGNLTGNIPPELGNLTNLERLYIIEQQVSGEIPKELGNLTNCNQFILMFNNLSGEIPKELENLSGVKQLYLNNNNLSGNIPPELANLNNLRSLQLNNNLLGGIVPDFSLNNLTTLTINDNKLYFADLEPSYSNNTTLTNYNYNPQKKTSEDETKTIKLGDNVVLDATIPGSNNQYQWFKDNVAISGETNATLNLTDVKISELGIYRCDITHPTITDLTLQTGDTTLKIENVDHPDYPALLALFNSTNGANWTNNTNWLDPNKTLDTWFGIIMENGRVKFISMHDNNLLGQIPSEIGNLEFLNSLQLSGNPNLYGKIPVSIGDLSNLEWLSLYKCGLSGKIPKEIGNLKKLKYLGLFENFLEGKILENISEINTIEYIEIYKNRFTGKIPESFASLNALNVLGINDNNFEGKIPDFSSSNSLTHIWFQDNKFQFGDFEDQHNTYFNNNNLNYFYYPQQEIDEEQAYVVAIGNSKELSSNASGTQNKYQWYKDDVLISGATNGTYTIIVNSESDYGNYTYKVVSDIVPNLVLTSKEITIGKSPKEHADYDALVDFYNSTLGDDWSINTNWLDETKPISSWYGITEENNRVTEIYLFNNRVYPHLTDSFGNLTELKRMTINFSFFNEGEPLPATLCNLSKLTYININNWGITGDFPSLASCNLANLTSIDIRNNNFTGQIPQEIADLPSLERFWAGGNNFTGSIPDFSNISSLELLYINNNKFQFGDFEDQHNAYINKNNLSYFYYPQQEIGDEQAYSVSIGDSKEVSFSVSGNQNKYQWYKDDVVINGATNSSLTIEINTESDYGKYHLEVTSDIVANLVLKSKTITIGKSAAEHPDYDALLALYNSTDGANWTNPWDLTKPISTWFGITFNSDNRVELLDIYRNNLIGNIPSEIGDLTTLKMLNLFDNKLTGEIPIELWNLTNLTDLRLGFNNLVLSNGIPSEISNLTGLELLNLSTIKLSQPIQPELFNLPKLNRLIIEYCALKGNLPKEFAKIRDVFTSSNELEGMIPAEIVNSTNNNFLHIDYNYFDFTDLKPLIEANNIPNLNYAPQKTRDKALEITVAPGEDIIVTVDDQGINRPESDQKNAEGNVYEWFKDDILITEISTNTLSLSNVTENDNGIYYCKITNPALPDLTIIRADITITIDTTASLDENNLLENVSLHPNPVNNKFTLKLQKADNASVIIYDVNGKEVLKKNIKSIESTIDISNLKNGVYMLSITSDNNRVTKRLIKI